MIIWMRCVKTSLGKELWSKSYRNRVTSLVFSPTESLFILNATLKGNFQYYINEYPKLTEAILEDMYADDLVSSINTIEHGKAIIKQ